MVETDGQNCSCNLFNVMLQQMADSSGTAFCVKCSGLKHSHVTEMLSFIFTFNANTTSLLQVMDHTDGFI